MSWQRRLQNAASGAAGGVGRRLEYEARRDYEDENDGGGDALAQCQAHVTDLQKMIQAMQGGGDEYEAPDYGGFDAFSSGIDATPPPLPRNPFEDNLKRGLQGVFRRQR